MTRANTGMETMPIAIWALMRPEPRTVTMMIARRRLGKLSITSMKRIRMLSVRPPAYPAIAPMMVPMTIANPTVTKPIQSETRAPYRTRLNSSRRFPSRPMMCCGWSSGQPRMWMQGLRYLRSWRFTSWL